MSHERSPGVEGRRRRRGVGGVAPFECSGRALEPFAVAPAVVEGACTIASRADNRLESP